MRFNIRGWAFFLACVGIPVITTANDVSAKRTIIVQPAGSVGWQQLVTSDSVAPAALEKQTVVPFIPVLKSREIALPNIVFPDNPSSGASKSVDPPGDESAALGPSLSTNFQALGDDNTRIPPDTMGAAGPSHLMTMLNTQVRIQNKTGSNLSTVSLATFWTSGTGLSGNPFDPIVVYDSIDDRWIATCDADSRSANASVFFAISSTSDPTGTWTFYSIAADTNGITWADFPGLGVNTNWIAITDNMLTYLTTTNFVGAKMWVIDKSTALAGGALTVTVFPAGFDNGGGYTGFTLKPCLTFGSETNLYIINQTSFSSGGIRLLRMSEITGTPAIPAWSTTAGSPFAGTGFFFVTNNFVITQTNATQLGTSAQILTNDPRMQNPVFRNGKIWCTHSAGLPVGGPVDRTAAFWYELDPALMASSGIPIVQSGVLDGGAGVHHFFPSITANANNDVCIGFSRSDSTRYVEAVATARDASDPAGTMDPITVIKAGEDSYIKDFGSGRIRWGDYSATVVDPADDLSFWTIQQYAETDVGPGASDDRWGTWWGFFGTTTSSTTSTSSTTTTTSTSTSTSTTTSTTTSSTTTSTSTSTTSTTTTTSSTTTTTSTSTTTTTTTTTSTTSSSSTTSSTTTTTSTTTTSTTTTSSTTTSTTSTSTSTTSSTTTSSTTSTTTTTTTTSTTSSTTTTSTTSTTTTTSTSTSTTTSTTSTSTTSSTTTTSTTSTTLAPPLIVDIDPDVTLWAVYTQTGTITPMYSTNLETVPIEWIPISVFSNSPLNGTNVIEFDQPDTNASLIYFRLLRTFE